MNFKKILSVFLTLVTLVGMFPVTISAASDCMVTDNIIDITDRAVYEKKGLGAARVTNIKITGADVVSAVEDGSVIEILLSGNTSSDATINAEFGTALDKNMTMSGHTSAITLIDGTASVSITLKGQYSSLSSLSGTATYTLNFSLDAAPVTPPVRITESDTKTTYSGVAVDLNLKDYFDNAKVYYLVADGEKTPVDGRTYTFRSFIGGTHTLVFAASNANGDCPDYVTVTVDVTEIQSGAWLGITTSNGSVDFVKFTDAEGNDIDGLTASLDDKNITVTLPRTFDTNGKITATFSLTQNGGLPKLSTSNAFNGSNDTKVFTNTLSNGIAKRTMYLYNANPKATSNVYTTYTISYAIENNIPTLTEIQNTPTMAEIIAGESFTLDLAPLFNDADGDTLTYSVKINGEAAISADANYNFTPELGGTYELEFFASDFISTSTDYYKVILTVTNSTKTYDMVVSLPEDITPKFYITNGYDENKTDIVGDVLAFEEGDSTDGYCSYTVSVPENITSISVRDEKFGGLSIPAAEESIVKLCKVQTEIIDFGDSTIPGSMSVICDEHKATGIDGNFLLMPDREYTFTALPENTSVYNSQGKTLTLTADMDTVTVKVPYKNPKTVTTTNGAIAKLFKYHNNYFVHTVFEPLATVDNENGTSTHYFAAEGDLSYRVSMDGRLTKAGYIKTGNSATVLHTDADKLPTDTANYLTETSDAAIVGDDSVLLNINQKNHLSLEIGETKTLKAYRAWQIIDLTYNNHIIEPDFRFNIISGEDVVSLEPMENQPTTNGSGNFRTLTAIDSGTAVIEVTYDAVNISGSAFDGFYGASDPARCGLFVVTVGENVPDVDFGIDCKTGSGSMVYNEANKKPWDSEFDTLYFTGGHGELSFSPTLTTGNITEIAVSADKGESYFILEPDDGVYTAPIAAGNNIIRITTDKGTAYQVVRGDKVDLSIKNVNRPGKAVLPGDEVSITLIGLHTPVPKIAGTYNPGYKNNTDGDGGIHLRYSLGDESLRSEGKQYNFTKEGTTLKLSIPENCKETEFTLTDGYIGFGVIGVTAFPDDGESHRNIPDAGGTTRGNSTTFHTRCILPDITVYVGMLPSGNNAPYIRENAPKTATLNLGGTYALSMSKVFTDRDNDTLSYTVKVNDGDAVPSEDYYTFTPDSIGTYSITFTAKDHETESDAHTVTLTVKEKSSSSSGSTSDEKWDISGDKIDGYVYISFADNGKRVEGESNITYPRPLGTIIPSKKVPYTKGDTVADVTLRLLDSQGFTYQHTGTSKSGFYLASIGDFTHNGISYDSFGEFDAGTGSGWMITLNKEFIKYGASDFEVKNGDTIKWQYTCQLGADIGDTFYSSSSSSSNRNNKANSESEKKKEETPKEETPEENTEEVTKTVFTEATFADVKKDDWYYNCIKYVYENNLMQGTGNGFEPELNMTRAMLVTILYRMANPEEKANNHNFADVTEGQWYSDAVAWASSNGIVSGVSENKFAPNEDITREQTALILYRFAQMSGYETSEGTDISAFSDTFDISDWAIASMKWAVGTKLINGTNETKLSPKASATRAQLAAMLMRFCKNIAK